MECQEPKLALVEIRLPLVYPPAMKPPEAAGEQVAKLSRALRERIHREGLTFRDVEDRLEMGRDYLSQLFRGSVDLKLKHVMAILDAIGVAPEEFFAAVYALAPASEVARLEFETDVGRVERLVMRDLVHVLFGKGLLTRQEAEDYLSRLHDPLRYIAAARRLDLLEQKPEPLLPPKPKRRKERPARRRRKAKPPAKE